MKQLANRTAVVWFVNYRCNNKYKYVYVQTS